jgi:addiction module HigA family antidote
MPPLKIKPIPPVDLAREELFARLSAELLPERISILGRGELPKVVDAAVQAYLFRNAIEVDPTARRNLTADLIKGLLDANPTRGRKQGRREYPVRRPLKRPPVHPGALMREILEDHAKLTIAEAARRMKVSRPALYAVLNGTATVTAEMALRFARLTGGAPELYLNMQTGHDLDQARQRLKDEPAGLDEPAHLRPSLGARAVRMARAGVSPERVQEYLNKEFGPSAMAPKGRPRAAPTGRPARSRTPAD